MNPGDGNLWSSRPFSKKIQERAGRDHPDAKTLCANEVAPVMRNDEVTAGFDGQFQNEIMLWIPQEWPPKKEDAPPIRYAADAVNEVSNVFGRQTSGRN